MAFDDIVESAKSDVDEKETEELKEKLGVEDKEDLKKLDDRIQTQLSAMFAMDRQLEQLEKRVDALSAQVQQLRQVLEDGD